MVKIRTLVTSAVQMVHDTIAAYLKKAEMNQLPSLILAITKEAIGCLEGFLSHALNLSEEDSRILAAIMTMHTGHDMENFASNVSRDFEKFTGRKPPEEIKKFMMVDDEEAVDNQDMKSEKAPEGPKKKQGGGVH